MVPFLWSSSARTDDVVFGPLHDSSPTTTREYLREIETSTLGCMKRHFELKAPHGKLVVVDVETQNQVDPQSTVDASTPAPVSETITRFQVSGDFFLEPDEAYDALGPALEGAPANESTDALQARLDAALSGFDDLDMQGFDTRTIAVAARRALAGGKDFTDYQWEILRPGVFPTAMNVALDDVLLKEVSEGKRGPTLRFWDWDDKATVIGSFQSYANEVDQEGVDKHNIQVVRRISGGGAMFMEGGNCITYSIYAPEDLVAGYSYADSYAYLDQWVLGALARHGVNAWYVPINDITSDGGKIGGAAQKRRGGAVLHHVTMSYDIDADKMLEVLRIGKVKVASKGIASAKKRVDPLRRQTGATREEIITTMINEFATRYGAQTVDLSDAAMAAGQELVETKYSTEEWTKRVH